MTYNIHHGASARGELNVHSIADVIAAHDAKIIGLQEVDRYWSERSAFRERRRPYLLY